MRSASWRHCSSSRGAGRRRRSCACAWAGSTRASTCCADDRDRPWHLDAKTPPEQCSRGVPAGRRLPAVGLARLPGRAEAQLAIPHQALKFLCEDLHGLVIHIGQLLPDASAALLVLTVGFETFEFGLQGRNHVIGLIAGG